MMRKTHEEALQAAALSVSVPIGVAQTIIATYLEARGAVLCSDEPVKICGVQFGGPKSLHAALADGGAQE